MFHNYSTLYISANPVPTVMVRCGKTLIRRMLDLPRSKRVEYGTSHRHVIRPTRQAQRPQASSLPISQSPKVRLRTLTPNDTTMPPSELDDFDSLVLQPFKLNHEVRLPKYAGGGMAGHVFKIHMNKKGYAPKMASFNKLRLSTPTNSRSSSSLTIPA